MIYYAPDTEQWEDSEDPYWCVDMTPEGGEPEEEFQTREEFYKWYYNGGEGEEINHFRPGSEWT